MTEKQKMLDGKIYDPSDSELATLRTKAHTLCLKYNGLAETNPERAEILSRLGIKAKNIYIQGPMQFDYGCFSEFGENFYANFSFTVLDCCRIKVGDNVFCGPNVSLLAPIHPLRWQDRNSYLKADEIATDMEYAKPITIGNNCWIAGNVTVCGGVTIGDGCVIGAGSVVTHDIPANSFAAGVPCKVIRSITENDSLANHPELF